MSTLGSITGQLLLAVGGGTVSLGTISIPIRAKTLPLRNTGDTSVTVELVADLAEVRDAVGAIFARGGDSDE